MRCGLNLLFRVATELLCAARALASVRSEIPKVTWLVSTTSALPSYIYKSYTV